MQARAFLNLEKPVLLYPRKNQIVSNSKVMNNPHKVGIVKRQNLLIVRRTVKQVGNFLLRHTARNQILLVNPVAFKVLRNNS